VQNWSETLSGGEKQRLAMARLLYHRPAFAVLDECTSAVSADGELKLYRECVAAGITLLSIAHRPALKHFHKRVLHIDGTIGNTGKGWWVEEVGDQELHHLEGHV
jgi:ATP-binding cassette subfamily D (ALD) protein 3